MNPRVLVAVLVALLSTSVVPNAEAQLFRRPTACDTCIGNWYYLDHDTASPGTSDWNCGTSTYDQHHGSDFSLIGGNGAINTGYDVVAMADGDVVLANDGNEDHCSTCPTGGTTCGTGVGFGYGNYLIITHGARRTYYAHLRRGSLRVSVGQHVTCGQVIGQIGSSGCSTGAHLHVETRPSSGAAYDPFRGSCSSVTSAWVSQGSYRGMPAPTCEGGTTCRSAGQSCSATSLCCGGTTCTGGTCVTNPVCPAGTYAIWTCNTARTSRRRCIDGVDQTEPCPYGCESRPTGTDDVCTGGPTCASSGQSCSTSTPCCSGLTCNGGTCGTAPTCASSGQSCSTSTPCCSGLTCNGGTCGTAPTCAMSGQSCSSSAPCCSGLTCNSGTCGTAPTCPSGTYPIWTCNAARTARRRCIGGIDQTESCANGCDVRPVGTDDVCAPPPATCSASGQSCSSSNPCCTGLVCTSGTCAAAPTCSAVGQSCAAASPCCNGLTCNGGSCAETPTCSGSGQTCATASACCTGLTCNGGVCGSAPSCGGATALWTCTTDGRNRTRCVNGLTETEGCPQGCTAGGPGLDAICGPRPDAGVGADVVTRDATRDVESGAEGGIGTRPLTGSCGCAVPGRSDRGSRHAGWLVVAMIALAARRRNRLAPRAPAGTPRRAPRSAL